MKKEEKVDLVVGGLIEEDLIDESKRREKERMKRGASLRSN